MKKKRMSLLATLLTIVALFGFAGSAMAFPPDEGQSEVVATYTFGVDTPESVATDAYGNVYVSMLLAGQIVKVDPVTGESQVYSQSDLAYQFCPPGAPAGVAGIWVNPLTRTMYANVNTCDPSTKGIWKASSDGAPKLLFELQGRFDCVLVQLIQRQRHGSSSGILVTGSTLVYSISLGSGIALTHPTTGAQPLPIPRHVLACLSLVWLCAWLVAVLPAATRPLWS